MAGSGGGFSEIREGHKNGLARDARGADMHSLLTALPLDVGGVPLGGLPSAASRARVHTGRAGGPLAIKDFVIIIAVVET